MPEDKPTGQAESKPKSKRWEFVKYQELSKEELVRMLMRVNKRLTRINKELQEIINILYYGEGSQNSGGRRRKQKRSESGDEEDVNYE